MEDQSNIENTAAASVGSGDLLAALKRELDSAVREYELAITRSPLDEAEIRRCVDMCASARERFNAANKNDEP